MESQSKSSWISSACMRCIWKFLVGIMCCWFICAWCPVMVGPALLMGGMWGYAGGTIMDILCLESMYRFPVLRCWLGLLACMEPWQTGGCTAPCGWITPVRAKNWLMDEQRSAIWVGSRDQLFNSACLMLSLSPWKGERSTSAQLMLLAIRQLSFSASRFGYQSDSKPVLQAICCWVGWGWWERLWCCCPC